MFREVVIDALSAGAQDANKKVGAIFDQLAAAATVDFRTGAASLDEAQAEKAVTATAGPDLARQYLPELMRLAGDGVAVLESPDALATPAVLPWRVFADARSIDALHPAVVTALGIEPGMSTDKARAAVSDRFPNAPDYVLQDQALAQAVDLVGKTYEEPRPGPLGPIEDINAMIDCFRAANWTAQWWGWSVGLDNPCAMRLADLLWAGAAPRVGAALGAAIAAATFPAAIAAAVQAAGGPFTLVLALSAFYLGLIIRLNVASAGVWINGIWPWPWTIWAQGRR